MRSRPKHRLTSSWFEACNALIDAYEAPLLRYASRLLANKDRAQDVVELAFIDHLRKCDEEVSPSHLTESRLYESVHHFHGRIAKQAHGDRSEAVAVAVAMSKLGRLEQCVIMLRVFEKKSWEEISAVSGLESSDAPVFLSRAMVSLADELRKAAG